MAITVGIFAMSGSGKTTSICINEKGEYNPAEGMNPKTTAYFNSDRKRPPFKLDGWVKDLTYFETSDLNFIQKTIQLISEKGPDIKAVIIDTVNGIMVDKEMLESKKMTYDKWMDLAKDIYEFITICNGLRDDLVIYIMGHVTLYTDVDGNESRCLVTNGKKLEKIKLESKLPIVLYGGVQQGANGDNKHFFETKANRSTGKTPIGMFSEFSIPNSLKLVDNKIREYYGIK